MKYFTILSIALLSACSSNIMPIEQDRALQLQYMQDVSERKEFRPEVYADEEFVADCEEHKMDECYN
jgi:hypothetical protein